MAELRKHVRRKAEPDSVTISYSHRGQTHSIAATLLDISQGGVGVRADEALMVGARVTVAGHLRKGAAPRPVQSQARVANCLLRDGGSFLIGISFEDAGTRNPFYVEEAKKEQQQEKPCGSDPPPGASFNDYYEFLQLSPSADPEMIHRAYRLLAQRYHPDNQETGNEEAFKLLRQAYDVLRDADRRAAYDLQHGSQCRLRWKIFDQSAAAEGAEAERRKRRGILALLYHKRLRQYDAPGMRITELEELLGCPREHLQFSLWYLKENGWIAASDQGRYVISAKGVDAAEADGLRQPQEGWLLTTTTP